jgi:hypothetical protein
MEDREVIARIGELVAKEHGLEQRHLGEGLKPDELRSCESSRWRWTSAGICSVSDELGERRGSTLTRPRSAPHRPWRATGNRERVSLGRHRSRSSVPGFTDSLSSAIIAPWLPSARRSSSTPPTPTRRRRSGPRPFTGVQFASLRHPDDPVDERGAGTGRRILFQAVPEPKVVKNRVHLDLLVGPEAHDAEVERLVGLGATVEGVHDGDEGRWTLLADPEGNEFDVS